MDGSTLQRVELTGGAFSDRRRIDGESVALVDNARVVAEFFGRAIVIEEAVVFPFDIVEFSVDVGSNLLMAAEFVGQEFEPPPHVNIAIQSANAAVFAVNEGLEFQIPD